MTYTGLYLGDFHLTNKVGGVEVLAEGTDFGNPEPEEVAVRSLLQDGDIIEHLRDGNRAQTLRIVLTGTAAVLEANEAALLAELYKRNTLTVPSLVSGGSTTEFDVVTSSLQQVPDDLAEVQANQRHYSVRLVTAPFGRSVDEVTVTALPTTGTTTTNLDSGAATTGWTGSHTVTSSGGLVRSTTGTVTVQTDLWLMRTIAAVDLSVQKYVVVDWSAPNVIRGGSLSCEVDGVAQEKVSEVLLPSGYTRSWFLSTDTSATTFKFAVTAKPFHPFVGSALELAIDKFDQSDVIPQVSTGRQLMRYVDIHGSARTEATLTLSHSTTGLGEVLVYTRPLDDSPYTPPLRVFKTSAGATTTVGNVSGAIENDLSTTFTATIPKRALPDGTYVLMARLAASGGGDTTLTCAARTRLTAYALKSYGSWTVDLTLTSDYKIYQLGPRFSIPTVGLANESDAQVVIDISDAVGGITVTMDEAWLFNLTDGSLTWVDLAASSSVGSFPAATKLWMFPPDVDTDYPRLMRGTTTTMSDAVSVTVATDQPRAWGDHEFPPGEVGIFTVTTEPANATVEVRYRPAWHTHAAAI